MEAGQNSRFDLGWTRANLWALIVVGLLAAGGLIWSAASGRLAVGKSIDLENASALSARERVNPNTASFASLRRLPELGPVRAQAIVDYRQAHGTGCFGDANDLLRIRGLGPGTLQTIREYLDFGPSGG